MQTLNLEYDSDETPYQIAQRAKAAAQDGDYLEVEGQFFIIRRGTAFPIPNKPPTVYRVNNARTPKVVQGSATLKPEVKLDLPPKKPALPPLRELQAHVETQEEKAPLIRTGAKASDGVYPGANLAPKDARRAHKTVRVAEVRDNGDVVTSKGRVIAAKRLNRYQVLV